jgi:hypothetical protein
MSTRILAAAPTTGVIVLRRSWLNRLVDALTDRLRARRQPRPDTLQAADYASLAGLSKHTLVDIGVPDWVREERRRELLWELDRARW